MAGYIWFTHILNFQETVNIIRDMISSLPQSTDKLKFRRASRLMLWPGKEVSQKFRAGAANALELSVEHFNGSETTTQITTILNQKVRLCRLRLLSLDIIISILPT